MKLKNLIATTCLVAPVLAVNAAYADFEFDDYPNKSNQLKLTYEQEDFPELQKALTFVPMEPNPATNPADADVIKGNSCSFKFPDDPDQLFSVVMDRIYEEVPEFAKDSENPSSVHQYKLLNNDPYEINIENADWVKAVLLDLSTGIINWRNSDSPEDAAEEDVRVLVNQTRPSPYAVYASRFGAHGDNVLKIPEHIHKLGDDINIYLLKSESLLELEATWDHPSYDRILVLPTGSKFDENLDILIPEYAYQYQIEFAQNIAEGDSYKNRVNQQPWEESKYRVQMKTFCLDSSHTTFINNVTEESGT